MSSKYVHGSSIVKVDRSLLPLLLFLAWHLVAHAQYNADEENLPVLPRVPAKVAKASADQIELGERLFFDARLSSDNTVSCSTCHGPEKAWTDGLPRAKGVGGKIGGRNSPTLQNVAKLPLLFWDGRAKSLEEQIRQPIENPIEMNMPIDDLVARLNSIEDYRVAFEKAFTVAPNERNVVTAIAAFVRTIQHGESPFDRYRAGDEDALSESARRGHDVFFFRTNCSTCHRAPLFTDHEFHNLGVGLDDPKSEAQKDHGRFVVSKYEFDMRAFKTPTLRNIALTAPYMHDGRLKTLEKVIEFYSEGGVMNPHLDPLMNVIPLSDQEKADLLVFLREGLTDDAYKRRATTAAN